MKHKKASKLLQSESEFLRDVPSEIQATLAWFHDGADLARLSDEMEHFVGGFLAALYDDGALFRVSKNAAWLLARFDRALQSLDRSLELEPKNVRAWTGRGLVFRQLGRHEEEAQCYRRSLDLDSSDPGLWLLYVNALRAPIGQRVNLPGHFLEPVTLEGIRFIALVMSAVSDWRTVRRTRQFFQWTRERRSSGKRSQLFKPRSSTRPLSQRRQPFRQDIGILGENLAL